MYKKGHYLYMIMCSCIKTLHEAIGQIVTIKTLFAQTQDKMKPEASKFYNKELYAEIGLSPYPIFEFNFFDSFKLVDVFSNHYQVTFNRGAPN